jgi:hypothetical protein
MRTASSALYRTVCVVMALMLLFPAIALAEPNVPGEVTVVTVTAPTTAAPAFVKAGGVVPVTYSTDGEGAGTVRYWLGASTKLAEEAVTLPVAKTVNLTIPAGTADGPWDLTVEANKTGQANWVQATQSTSIIVDSSAPVVPNNTLLQPNGGEYLQVGAAYDIKWDAAKIVETNLAGIDLELWVGGAFHSTIASGLGNTGGFAWTVSPMVTQQAKVRLVVKDVVGNSGADESDKVFTIFNTDATPPAVAVTGPLDNAYITGNSATVSADASDPESGVSKVVFEYSKDGGAWTAIGTDMAAPYVLNWDVSGLADGAKLTVRATAHNGAGASAWDTNGNIVIDRSKPGVAITAPANGALVAGCHTWKADASDAQSAVASVQFWYSTNGTDWIASSTDVAAPYEENVCFGDGFVWVKGLATNGAGLTSESAAIKYEVDATAPAIKATTLIQPNGGGGLQIGTVYLIKWEKADITDKNLGDKPVTLWLTQDGGVTFTQIDGALANTGSFSWSVSGIPSANSWVKLMVTDKVGNQSSDMSDAAFTVFAVDNTSPKTAVTDPVGGAWVTGVKLVKASASDPESGIVEVSFWADTGGGFVQFALDTAAPYEQNWNPAGFTGDAKLKVAAKNGVGMVTESAVVSVHVDNSLPWVDLQQPNGGVVSGTAYEMISDSGDTGSGVAAVIYEVQPNCGGDWIEIGTATAAPFKLAFDTTALPDGVHCFAATAKDKVGLMSGRDVAQGEVKNTYSIALKAGWNLISTPLVPYNTDIATAFKNLPVKQVASFVWASGKLTQQTWLPGVGGTLKTFKDGQGYWVEMKNDATLVVKGRYLAAPPNVLPAYAASTGWNLIGYTARYNMTNEPAGEYLGSLLGSAEANYAYNADGDYYYQTWTYNAGLGYWLALSKGGTIYP